MFVQYVQVIPWGNACQNIINSTKKQAPKSELKLITAFIGSKVIRVFKKLLFQVSQPKDVRPIPI